MPSKKCSSLWRPFNYGSVFITIVINGDIEQEFIDFYKIYYIKYYNVCDKYAIKGDIHDSFSHITLTWKSYFLAKSYNQARPRVPTIWVIRRGVLSLILADFPRRSGRSRFLILQSEKPYNLILTKLTLIYLFWDLIKLN